MDEGLGILISGGLSMLILEGLKLAIQKLGGKPAFGYPTWFYIVMLPVLNALVPFAMLALGYETSAPIVGMPWQGVVRYVISIALGSVISLLGYNDGVKPLKAKAEELKLLKG